MIPIEHWMYQELIDAVYEQYEDFVVQEKGHKRKALFRVDLDFCDMGKTEDLIILMVIGEILLTHEKVFMGYINNIQSKLGSFRPEDHDKELTQTELTDLTQRIQHVLHAIQDVNVVF